MPFIHFWPRENKGVVILLLQIRVGLYLQFIAQTSPRSLGLSWGIGHETDSQKGNTNEFCLRCERCGLEKSQQYFIPLTSAQISRLLLAKLPTITVSEGLGLRHSQSTPIQAI
jgi:hypothetical protein